MQERYKQMLDNLEQQVETKEELKLNDRVLIIDSLNAFIRSFTVINHINKHNHHIGGLTGYLKSLGYAINLIRPTRFLKPVSSRRILLCLFAISNTDCTRA